MANRIEITGREFGLTLAQAIILAEYGDVIVVRTENQKEFGQRMARTYRPGKKIDFVVEPEANPLSRNDSDDTTGNLNH